MRASMFKRFLTALFLIAACGYAFSGDAVVSTMKNVSAYFDFYGYSIRPIGTTTTPGDHGPTQLFEIVRPSYGSLTIGRIYTSCTCIQVTADKRTFASGESAVLTVRNVLPTSGNTYPFYVQVNSPIKTTLRYDTYVISDRFTGATSNQVTTAAPASNPNVEPPTKLETQTSDGIEIIVPKYEPPVEEKAPEETSDNTVTTTEESTEQEVAASDDAMAPDADEAGEETATPDTTGSDTSSRSPVGE